MSEGGDSRFQPPGNGSEAVDNCSKSKERGIVSDELIERADVAAYEMEQILNGTFEVWETSKESEVDHADGKAEQINKDLSKRVKRKPTKQIKFINQDLIDKADAAAEDMKKMLDGTFDWNAKPKADPPKEEEDPWSDNEHDEDLFQEELDRMIEEEKQKKLKMAEAVPEMAKLEPQQQSVVPSVQNAEAQGHMNREPPSEKEIKEIERPPSPDPGQNTAKPVAVVTGVRNLIKMKSDVQNDVLPAQDVVTAIKSTEKKPIETNNLGKSEDSKAPKKGKKKKKRHNADTIDDHDPKKRAKGKTSRKSTKNARGANHAQKGETERPLFCYNDASMVSLSNGQEQEDKKKKKGIFRRFASFIRKRFNQLIK